MKLVDTNAVGSRLKCSGETKDETPESLKEDLLLCTLDIKCLISNKITGNVDVPLELPGNFQTMLWEVQPNKTWNHLQTYINHTLTPSTAVAPPSATKEGKEGTGVTSSLLFAGTKLNPTTLNFGLLRSMLEDQTENKKVGLPGGREEGVQLTWAGTTPVESATGPTGATHFVSFRFGVSSFVLDAKALDSKDMTTLFISVLTLLLSIMSLMHLSKMISERWIDVWLTWYAEKNESYTLPEDVQRRQRVLEEHAITGVPGSSQRRMSSMHNIHGGSGPPPQRQRRLSSRELMQQKKSNTTVDSNVVADIELTIKNGDSDARVFANPMKKNNRQTSSANGDVELKREIAELKKEMQEMKKQMAMMISGAAVPSPKTVAKTTPKTKNKKWKSAKNKLKSVSAFKQRRRSTLMTSSAEVDLTSSVNIHVDEATGRKYSFNATTGGSEWLD